MDGNLFEVATRGKFRFEFRGLLGVEDLWDLGVKDLDCIFKGLNAKTKQEEEESLLGKRTKQGGELSVKLSIVKYIVSTKLKEEESRLKLKENIEMQQKIMGILANKQDEELLSKTPEELQKILDTIE